MIGGQGNTFALLAVDAIVDSAVGLGLSATSFPSTHWLDPNSPDFSVHNPDEFIGQLFFHDPNLNSGNDHSV